MGSGSIAGFGHSMICEAQPGTYQSGRRTTAGLPLAARSRASITVIGSIKACAAHPGPGQRVLYTLTGAPGLLGWLIIAGSVAAALIQGFAQDLLLNTMFASPASFGNLIIAPFQALLPVSPLAGAALLTFARIIRVGCGHG